MVLSVIVYRLRSWRASYRVYAPCEFSSHRVQPAFE